MTTDTDTTTTPLLQFLRAMPKVEIHCHLLGAVRHSTFMDLVRAAALRALQQLSTQHAKAFVSVWRQSALADKPTTPWRLKTTSLF